MTEQLSLETLTWINEVLGHTQRVSVYYPDEVARLIHAARNGGWQPIESAPRDGTPLRIRTCEVMRWLAYKPDGARQMKKAGRWQKHDGFGWANCPDPSGPWQFADSRAAPPSTEGK